MASTSTTITVPSTTAPPPTDELDDLFDYNPTLDDVFRDVDTDMRAPSAPNKRTPLPSRTKPTDKNSKADSLGIDEEVKIKRQRAPIAKLDEERLLAPAGIPKLRRIAKGWRFKGRGHEFSDTARLLQHYQLWLDELYPRAKFADGLAMIEKVGHTKKMQTMRRVWIDEGKPSRRRDEDEELVREGDAGGEKRDGGGHNGSQRGDRDVERERTPSPKEGGDDDLYGASPQGVREEGKREMGADAGTSLFISDDEGVGGPEGDELDALLAEDMPGQDKTMSDANGAPENGHMDQGRKDDFDDEMEAMAGMDDMW